MSLPFRLRARGVTLVVLHVFFEARGLPLASCGETAFAQLPFRHQQPKDCTTTRLNRLTRQAIFARQLSTLVRRRVADSSQPAILARQLSALLAASGLCQPAGDFARQLSTLLATSRPATDPLRGYPVPRRQPAGGFGRLGVPRLLGVKKDLPKRHRFRHHADGCVDARRVRQSGRAARRRRELPQRHCPRGRQRRV
jgi:hypothetical protein